MENQNFLKLLSIVYETWIITQLKLQSQFNRTDYFEYFRHFQQIKHAKLTITIRKGILLLNLLQSNMTGFIYVGIMS